MALHIYNHSTKVSETGGLQYVQGCRLHRGTLWGGWEEDCRLDIRDQGGFISLAILLTLSHVGGILEQRQLCK